ncbi:MAG: hypothetical protein PVH82_16765 [Desulfobacteraceae bacterium]|jgi:hypothetical protein
METVSVEIEKPLAENLSQLARQGVFGSGLVNCELDMIVTVLLNKVFEFVQTYHDIETRLQENSLML